MNDGLAKEIASVAESENKTMYGFANECFESILKIYREHGKIEEIYPFWIQTRMSKEFGGLPLTPRYLLDSIIRMVYPKEKEALIRLSFESGRMFGAYLKLRAKNLDELRAIINLVGSSNPGRLMEIVKMDNFNPPKYVLRYVTGISDETTICLERYFAGMLSVFSSTMSSKIQSSGIVEIEVQTDA